MMETRILPVGDRSLQVEFGQAAAAVDAGIAAASFCTLLEKAAIPGVSETLPVCGSVMVHYRPEIIGWGKLKEQLQELLYGFDSDPSLQRVVEAMVIPILYGGETGAHIQRVAEHAGISIEEVGGRHSAHLGLVQSISGALGTAYLEHDQPAFAPPCPPAGSTQAAAGAVGVRGSRTALFAAPQAGGWYIIGRTPLCLFDPEKAQPSLLTAGRWVCFRPVDELEFYRIQKQVGEGTYVPQTKREVR